MIHFLISFSRFPVVDVLGRFKKLVMEKGEYEKLDEKTLERIQASGFFSSRLLISTDPDSASKLYGSVEQIPQTATRAKVYRDTNVKIDGEMLVPNCQDGTIFLHAFENNLPRVLKIPSDKARAVAECNMYNTVCAGGATNNFALVPVRYISLDEGSRHTKGFSPKRVLTGGILMPSYACTLDSIPVPISKDYALAIFDRLAPAIDHIHLHRWFHGDIKPSNIFIGTDGQLWLGDYGSSAQYDAVLTSFHGGTTRYQCSDCLAKAGTLLRFDKLGLIISILEKSNVIYWGADKDKKDCYSYSHIKETVAALDERIKAWLEDEVIID